MNREHLEHIMTKLQESDTPWPYCFPEQINKAADHWLNHQRPMWKESLIDYYKRIIYSFRKFVRLTPGEQSFIIGAAEEKCFYNGEDMKLFKIIYDEHSELVKVGVDQYKRKSLKSISKIATKRMPDTAPKREQEIENEKQRVAKYVEQLKDIEQDDSVYKKNAKKAQRISDEFALGEKLYGQQPEDNDIA